jgi:peptidyl-tRNA hydrolase, PTH1 family
VADRWIIAGLGNPEAEYGGSRHNIGADVVRRLAERRGATLKPHKKAQAQVADTFASAGGTPLSLVVPFGYMNRSGGPVQQAMRFYKVPHERLVVVHDDLDLDVGKLRLKQGGGDAGHNGLRDIRNRTGASIVAVLSQGELVANPGPDYVFRAEDMVAVLGRAPARARGSARGKGR